MANNETLGASFSIDVTDLKTGLAQANRMIKESESEFRAAAAGMDDWTESEEGLNAKIKSLNSVTELQRKKVDALTAEYDRLIADGLDPTSKEAVELRTKINNETTALNKNEAELKKQTQALEDLEKGSKDAGDATDDMGDKFSGLKAAGGVAAGAIAAVGAACVAAVGAFLGLAESTREARENMAKIETSFESAGLSAKAAEDTFTELYSVIGDEGAAGEAAQQLAKISKNEKDLQANTRILTGVMAEYGASIPTEGLAEGMAATAAMGSVQGVLADALEWQGVNLDDVNAKLETLATEEERAAYIQSELTKLYGDSADAYRENNAEIIASREAQAKLNEALNELGAIAEPIMTTLKTLAADLLTTITPFVSLMGKGLKGALDGTAGAADKLAEGLNGIITSLLDKIIEMIPFVIDTIVAIVPQLLTALLNKLPTILQTVVDIILQVVDALREMLPTLLPEIVKIIMWIITTITENIPALLEAAIQFFTAIVEAIPTIIDVLTENLQEVIITVIWGLIDAIPQLLQAAIKLFNAIVKAIPVIIESLTYALPSIIQTIIEGLIEAIPVLLDGAITLLMAIVQAIPTIIDALVVQLPHIIRTIIGTLLSNLPLLINAAIKLFFGILEAIPKIIVELVKQMPQIIKSIVKGLSSGVKDVAKIGGDIIRGLWNGISDMAGWIGKKIKGFGETVLGGLKDFFGIKSPSKLMADVVGKNIALGIGEGFEKNIAGVNKEITDAIDFDDPKYPNGSPVRGGRGAVTVYQTNNYSQSHSRYELYKSQQQTAAAVRLALGAG